MRSPSLAALLGGADRKRGAAEDVVDHRIDGGVEPDEGDDFADEADFVDAATGEWLYAAEGAHGADQLVK